MIIIAGNTATNGIKYVEESAMCYGTLGVYGDLCRSDIAVETRTCFHSSWVWSVFSGGSQACKRPESTTMRKDSDTREEKMELYHLLSLSGGLEFQMQITYPEFCFCCFTWAPGIEFHCQTYTSNTFTCWSVFSPIFKGICDIYLYLFNTYIF